MTDTVVATTVSETDAKAPQTPDKAKLSPLAGMVLTQLETRFTRVNEIADVQKSVGDVGQLITDAIEKSTNKDVVALRKKVEEASEFILKAKKTMEDAVKPTLKVPSDEELASLDTEYKELATEINTFNSVFTAEVKKDFPDLDVFAYFGALPGKKRGAKAGQGTGSARPRVQSIEITTDLKGEEGWSKVANKDGKSTFSVLAAHIKSATDGGVDLPASDFHDAWTHQNSAKDWTELPDVSSFVLSATGENEKSYKWHVRVTK